MVFFTIYVIIIFFNKLLSGAVFLKNLCTAVEHD